MNKGAITILALSALLPSATNPRKRFDEAALQELALSIKHDGLLSPIIVRSLDVHKQADRKRGQKYEIVAGERRYRAAKIAEVAEVPCIIRELSDDDVLRIQVIENLQRENVHPMEEAQGFKALLDHGVMDAKAIAAATGKPEAYIYGRLKLCELQPLPQKALEEELIGIGHALLLAKLDPKDQAEALGWCGIEVRGEDLSIGWNGITKIPALRQRIEREITRDMTRATWDLSDQVTPEAVGPCTTCIHRTSNNGILFPELGNIDRCTNRTCWNLKLDAVLEQRKTELAASGSLVQITESWMNKTPGVLDRNSYRVATNTVSSAASDTDLRFSALGEWITTLEQSEDGGIALAPRTFNTAVEYARQTIQEAGDDDDEWIAEQMADIDAGLAKTPREIENEGDIYVESETGAEWPRINDDPSEFRILAGQLPEGAVQALMVDGPDRGRLVPVIITNQSAAAKAGVAGEEAAASVSEAEAAERRARKEQLRQQRAEKLARRRIFDAVCKALAFEDHREADHGASAFVSANVSWLIPLAFARLVRCNGYNNFAGQDPENLRHPGKDQVWRALRLDHSGPDDGHGDQRIFEKPYSKSLEGLFVAMTWDEIAVGERNPQNDPGLALFKFAEVLEIDVEGIRKQAEFDTLSKKQQQERLKEQELVGAAS